MSLIISVWTKTKGIAVCEGRAIAKVNGTKVPVCEDHSKLSRLPDGSILGLTGGLRPGYETSTLRDGVVTEPLRRAIHQEAEKHSFSEMRSSVIPRLFAEYGERYPELGFGVSLLGNDNGTIRGAAWSSTGRASVPADVEGVSANILGLNETANGDVTEAVRQHFALRDSVESGDAPALEEIIKRLAPRYVELNDNTRVEIISSDCGASVDGFCLNLLEPKEAGANVTSAHVLTAVSKPPATFTTASTTLVPVTNWGFTVACSGPNDVYNIDALGWFSGSAAALQIAVCVDGNTTTPAFSMQVPPPAGMNTSAAQIPFACSITGLSAGARTLQVYMSVTSSVAGVTIQSSAWGTYAMCQRIF